jgi:hypothetical protein
MNHLSTILKLRVLCVSAVHLYITPYQAIGAMIKSTPIAKISEMVAHVPA